MILEQREVKILVIGGGNIGTQFACMCASKGYTVNLLTSHPEKFHKTIEIVDECEVIKRGTINKASSKLEDVIHGCGIIFVTYPAFMLQSIAEQLTNYIDSGMLICVLPGTGGVEFAFRSCIDSGATVLGLQRVPSVARLEKYGKRVRCEGLRNELFIGSIPSNGVQHFAPFLSNLCDVKCSALPNYLSITLTPSNPILHTTRLRILFCDYEEGKKYKRNPAFYGEWNDESSKLLIDCDSELQSILSKLEKLDMSSVKSLREHYGSNTISEMTRKLRSIKSLHNLPSPMIQVKGEWIPDFSSRYFTADFPFGLSIIEAFARILEVDVPHIDATMDWYRSTTHNAFHYDLKRFGIQTVDDIYRYY